MKLEELSPLELVVAGRRAEEACIERLEELRRRLDPKDAPLRIRLDEILDEERRHRNVLSGLERTLPCPRLWQLDAGCFTSLVRSFFPSLRQGVGTEVLPGEEVIHRVQALERDSVRFYRTLAEAAPPGPVRQCFDGLAAEEERHGREETLRGKPRYPGERVTANGNEMISVHTEVRYTEAGVFYPITPSTEAGELYQRAFAEGKLNVFGRPLLAIEAEGEHAAMGGAIAHSLCGRRVVNFTSGQGLAYALEQYYHAPGKASTLVVEVAARALTKHALNVHCGHDDIYAALDTGWIILFAKDAQQAADQALILRRVTELSLTPGINAQDGFLTSHLERTFYRPEDGLLREFLGAPEDVIDCPTESQRAVFGPKRRRVPAMIDLRHPVLVGPVQNQEHYMQGVVARRNAFAEPILSFLAQAYREFGRLTGRFYGLLSPYRTEDAETVFVSLGSAAENIEAAVDYLRRTRGARVGSIHMNVLRPFPEAAVVEALRGKRRAIVLERTDQPLAGDNPLGRDLRAAFTRALQGEAGLPKVTPAEIPRFFSGVYGLGSRDFRPEHILGAWEYACGLRGRKDGKRAEDGASFFVLGVDHPYEVRSDEAPSLLPEGAVAVRFHSIGGWGAITTGKNLGAILADLNDFLAERDRATDAWGRPVERIHVSANPKYGSEKKGAPTAYFLVLAPERIRVNCDLRHVDVVLCCDPKAFTHTNPLEGLAEGGAFVWESDEDPDRVWERIPVRHRREILEKKIRLYVLRGFEIARRATDRPELQRRMQGNAFLGAFFRVSPVLERYGIDFETFRTVVGRQYAKKFARFGEAVVRSNMVVMTEGYEGVREVRIGPLNAPDRSDFRGRTLDPVGGRLGTRPWKPPAGQPSRPPYASLEAFHREYRAGLGYHQPATPLAALGVMAAASGDAASKFVSRLESPQFIAENCTQCLECVSVCPDTALPNGAYPLSVLFRTAAEHYVTDPGEREKLLGTLPEIERRTRAAMVAAVQKKSAPALVELVRQALADAAGEVAAPARREFLNILGKIPMAYARTNAVFATPERKAPGSGGVFCLFVSDLCKGCAACVEACGERGALRMVPETEALRADSETAMEFFRRLPETPSTYLGLYDARRPLESKPAALRNHLMVRCAYEAFVGGDGACAGCGQKSVLRAVASVTEAYMRPLYHAKAERLQAKARRLLREGGERLASWARKDPAGHARFVRAVAHLLLGQVGAAPDGPTVLRTLAAVLEQDAFNHRELQAVDGRLPNGMAVMAMAAHTGCNTVYGSTPPNNPHPYPWMNSLFQDGVTVAWLFGESFISDHARRSVIPERLADVLLEGREDGFTEEAYDALVHFSDTRMTDQEIRELPKVWAVGGDGGMGDIGFQNVSKVVLQNRPNVKVLMLDTQVYSNTGGQNSDSTPMPGGSDMNAFGAASQGKLVERKSVAEAWMAGHGSPFVAQVSMANPPKLYRVLLEALDYRGTAFLQCYTPCQPEHGIGDAMAPVQARRARDSRAMPEFVFNPRAGETYAETVDLTGNPDPAEDWAKEKFAATGEVYRYTPAHWAYTEARFRPHFRRIRPEEAAQRISLEDMLARIRQDDVVYRRYLDPAHRAFVPDFGVVTRVEDEDGRVQWVALSRQMVLFCVERRKAWRLLQSKAGVDNRQYRAQRALLADVDAGKVPLEALRARTAELLKERMDALSKETAGRGS